MSPTFKTPGTMVTEIVRSKYPTYTFIKVESADDVIRIILNNADQQNVFNIAMIDEMTSAFKWAQQEKGKLIILEPADGLFFPSQIDKTDEAPEKAEKMFDAFSRLLKTMLETEKIIVSAFDYTVRHKAVALALCSDIVIMSDMGLIYLTDVSLGRFCPFAAYLLPRVLPWPRAAEILLSESTIKAEKAEALGLATRVVPRRTFKAEVNYYIHRYLKNSGHVLGLGKKAALARLNQDFAKDMENIKKIYMNDLLNSADYKEGYNAFKDRRDPVWKDK